MGKKYAETHEWVELEGGIATIGISRHAAEELGDITYVDLPKPGTAFGKGEVIVTIESVKAAGDVFSPIAGTVTEVNGELADRPEIVNESAEEAGWLCRLKDVDTAGLDGLMDEAAYAAWVKSEKSENG